MGKHRKPETTKPLGFRVGGGRKRSWKLANILGLWRKSWMASSNADSQEQRSSIDRKYEQDLTMSL